MPEDKFYLFFSLPLTFYMDIMGYFSAWIKFKISCFSF